MFFLGETSRKNLYGVDAELYKVVELALTISKIDFGIPSDGGLRTAERQNELYKLKVTKLDGYNKKSYHQTGKAFDVFAYVDGKASWNTKHLTHIATAILAAASQIGVVLEWGGHWMNFVDMPHFQKPR
tara:strand:+ start:3839 stop:4225 length:387 start_codon:yes stop_codon:yes gene_type:complete